MPELPDVETFRKYLDSTSLHQRIEKVEVKRKRVLEGVSPQSLGKALHRKSFEGTDRYGKYLFVETGEGPWLVLHFGMTGYLKYFRDPDDRPEHERVLFTFSNGHRLAYVCQRLLGKVGIAESPDSYIGGLGLGPDARNIDFENFRELFDSGPGSVKSALMNQDRIAGLGNVYVDEILYQARIHPKRKKSGLTEEQIRKVYDKMNYVLETAIDKGARVSEMPDNFLLPRREEGEKCPGCGGEIGKTRVSGRGTYFCPRCQE